MRLPALEFLERRQIGISIIKRDHEAERYLAIVLMIEKSSTPGITQRPPLSVNDSTWLMSIRRNIPQLFDSQSEDLWAALLSKVEDLGQAFRQMSARAFSEQC